MSEPLRPLLAAEKLAVVYHHAITAIQGVSLTVEKGQIVAILGTNGAGKSTTLRALSGFLGIDSARVTEGSVIVQGPAHREPPAERSHAARHRADPRAREGVSESHRLRQSVRAVRAGHDQGRTPAPARSMVYSFFPRLGDLRARIGGLLSGGERQMLALASGLMCKPELLLVDELSLGLAPVIVEDLMQRLVQIRNELDITIVIVEQSASIALDIADYGYVLENGRVVLDGSADKLMSHGDIQEFYLGQAKGSERRNYRDVKQYRRSRRWYG